MKKISNINKYIKNMKGKVLGIGINDTSIIEEIDKNNKIYLCDLLDSISLESSETSKKTRKKYIKKIRKNYKKKDINYIIIDPTNLFRKLKFLIRDTIYINNQDIYIYMDKEYDYELIIKRYQRYTKDIKLIKCDDGYIIKVNSSNAKNNYFKDKLYYILDTLNNIADVIGDILVN